MTFPTAVHDLLKSLELVTSPSGGRVEAGTVIKLTLDPPVELFQSLVGEQLLQSLKIDLKDIAFDRFNTVAAEVPLDIGTVATELAVNLGQLRPVLDLTLGTVMTSGEVFSEGLPSTVELDATQKEVEFGTPFNEPRLAENKMPYLVPQPIGDPTITPLYLLGEKVRGFLGRLVGTFTPGQGKAATLAGTLTHKAADGTTPEPGCISGTIDSIAPGEITGAITHHDAAGTAAPGHISLPDIHIALPTTGQLLATVKATVMKNVEVDVQWRVEGPFGPLTPGRDYLLAHTDDPARGLVPVIAFLPEPAESTRSNDLLPVTERRLYCTVTVSGTLPSDEPAEKMSRELGPVTFFVPKVPIPSVLVLTENAISDDGSPGMVLVGVPEASSIDGVGFVEIALDPLRRVIENFRHASAIFGGGLFAATAAALDRAVKLISSGHVAFSPRDIVLDLRNIRHPLSGRDYNDLLSGCVLIGPPGRSVQLHVFEGGWYRGGVLRITLGELEPAAIIRNLASPAVDRPGGVYVDSYLTVEHPATDGEGSPRGTFNDCLTSFQFLPLGGPAAPRPPRPLMVTVEPEERPIGAVVDLSVSVTDAVTRMPITGATVLLRNGDADFEGAVEETKTTDQAGRVTFTQVFLRRYSLEDVPRLVQPCFIVQAAGFAAARVVLQGESNP